MKKFTFSILTLVAFMLVGFNSQAQMSALYEDDFESYNVGDYVAQSIPDWWTTWSNAPGGTEDGQFSDEFAASGSKAIKVTGTTTDLVLKLGNKTSGFFNVKFNYMIPEGMAGYYNIQHFEQPGNEWAHEVYFDNNGTGYIHGGGSNAATFTYTQGEWIEIVNEIDLDAAWAKIYFNGELIHEYDFNLQAAGEAGTNMLGAVNFFAGASTGMTPTYYVDDIVYEQSTDSFLQDFEGFNAGDYVAVVDPEHFTTWSNAPGGSEDAMISTEAAASGTKSVKVDGTTDLVWKLGNKTSGSFNVKFNYMVPEGMAGYYNVQHYEQPGTEWAHEIYFDNNGTGYLNGGGANAATFTYTQGEWIAVENIIDLNAAWAQIYFDGVLIHEYDFNLQAQGEAGTNMLGGVNFYAGASTGMTSTYFFDDIELVVITPPATDPTVDFATTAITKQLEQGEVETVTRALGNVGGADLNYVFSSSYEEGSKEAREDVTLGYCGEFDGTNGVGNQSGDVFTYRCSARFPASMMAEYNGMYLTAVQIGLNDIPNDVSIQVYGMGSTYIPGPGELIYEQTIANPATGIWHTETLAEPVYIDGNDIWIGYWLEGAANTYPAGVDAGPHHADGDWFSTGPGWSHLSDGSTLDYNWCIRGLLTGEAGPVWLTIDPATGTLAPDETVDVNIEINTTDLAPEAAYQGTINLRSNDPVNPWLTTSVNLIVLVGLNENGEQAYVSMYPNPTKGMLTLDGNTEITKVTIVNNIGQVVYNSEMNTMRTNINLDFGAGMYFVTIETANGTSTQKVVVE